MGGVVYSLGAGFPGAIDPVEEFVANLEQRQPTEVQWREDAIWTQKDGSKLKGKAAILRELSSTSLNKNVIIDRVISNGRLSVISGRSGFAGSWALARFCHIIELTDDGVTTIATIDSFAEH